VTEIIRGRITWEEGRTAGFALFALGFRPFYLLAAAYAAVSVPLWAFQYSGVIPGANMLWHAHEMLFGYAFAVIAGFLLTAVRLWSGRPTPTGLPLAFIAGLWLAARILGFFSLHAAAIVDAAFAFALAWGIGRPLVASGNRRNWFFIPLIIALGAASAIFLAYPRFALVIGLDIVLFVMAVMGGRVIPAFTNSAIPGAGARRDRYLEYGALGAVLLILSLDIVGWDASVVALGCALLHAARLALWMPWKTRGKPILWILHASYAWIPIHLLMRGLAGFELVPDMLATHALTVGAIGGLTIGMMTRTARGHTARPLRAGAGDVTSYLLIQAAAVSRVLLPLAMPAAYTALVSASALLWFAGFTLYAVLYWPILSRPRLDGKPG
jgi:uncharacterized protein involved in response to NO